MVKGNDHLDITIAVDWDIKSQTMRGSRNFRQGGPGQSDKKKL